MQTWRQFLFPQDCVLDAYWFKWLLNWLQKKASEQPHSADADSILKLRLERKLRRIVAPQVIQIRVIISNIQQDRVFYFVVIKNYINKSFGSQITQCYQFWRGIILLLFLLKAKYHFNITNYRPFYRLKHILKYIMIIYRQTIKCASTVLTMC